MGNSSAGRRRWRHVLRRLLLVYALVELAVIFTLVSTIGWGWTLLVLLATFLLGWGLLAPMAGHASFANSGICGPAWPNRAR